MTSGQRATGTWILRWLWLGFVVAVVGTLAPSEAVGGRVGGTITTIAGFSPLGGYSGDGGPATKARLRTPEGLAFDGQGNLYIYDCYNARVRKVSPGGTITTIAGGGSVGFPTYGDGGAATKAQLRPSCGVNYPAGVAVDGNGNVYIADTANNRVRKVDPAGIISTYAGSGRQGFSGDGGAATTASLYYPSGLAVDRKGNLYIADSANRRVRMVSTNGTITTMAGNGTGACPIGCPLGDGGPATSAPIDGASSVAVDGKGNVYLGSWTEDRVRKVDGKTGIITTFAGPALPASRPYFGDGGPANRAYLYGITGVAVDARGSVFIADGLHRRIRKVGTDGIITTYAGNGQKGISGDGGPAVMAGIATPAGVALDGLGNLFVSSGNYVRKITVRGAATAPTAGPVTGAANGTVLVNGKAYKLGPIPYGSKVDVTKGKVTLKADVGTLTASGGGGISAQFILLRAKAAGGPIVELRLTGGDFKLCAKRAAQSRNAGKTVRRLWAKGDGKFRTRGRYASATIRGTDWLTADRCDGTFVKTRQGVVSVLDFVLKKTMLVKAGKSYLAKKR